MLCIVKNYPFYGDENIRVNRLGLFDMKILFICDKVKYCSMSMNRTPTKFDLQIRCCIFTNLLENDAIV